jgi:hypothetical protein
LKCLERKGKERETRERQRGQPLFVVLKSTVGCFESESFNHTASRYNRQAMATPISQSTRAVGFWSAVLSTVFSLAYVVGQLAEWLGWLGSEGGPESASTLTGLVVLLTPSLFLGSSFLVLLVSIHQLAAHDRKVWSHAAVAFGSAYAVLISIVYFVQLSLVAPRIAQGRTAGIEVFLFVPFDSFLYAVDILGYSFMSVSTLFAAQALTGRGIERAARFWLTANGLLVPFLALQMYFHSLIWIASFWAVTFPAATWSLAVLFHRTAPDPTRPGALGA